LQRIFGPTMQIVTVFALLGPLYYAAKLARRRLTVGEAGGVAGQGVGGTCTC
jgi:hypothetical protein